jgi:hypothetical protein
MGKRRTENDDRGAPGRTQKEKMRIPRPIPNLEIKDLMDLLDLIKAKNNPNFPLDLIEEEDEFEDADLMD